MATVTTAGLPSGAFTSSDELVGNQGGATKRLTLSTSGLSDVESGTWTPTLYGATTGGTTTYVVQNGVYRKIGDVCFCAFELEWSNSTGTGIALIGGLPFACASQSGDTRYNVGISDYGSLNFPTSERIGGYIRDGLNYILLLGNEINDAASASMTNLTTEAFLKGSFTYIV